MQFGLTLFSTLALSASLIAAQDLCPEDLFLLTSEDYQVTKCIFVDNADSCAGCNQPDGFDVNTQDSLSCAYIEEQLCSDVRCCEACWEKSQNFAQCFIVEPNWSRNGGLVEDGCVIDCSNYPIGGGGVSSPTDSTPTTSPVSSPSDNSPVNTVQPDEDFIKQCQAAANNLNCRIEKCTSCGDGGYASLDATQIPELKAAGSFFNCAQMEAAVCPEIRCCEACDYTPVELWYQCNVVQSYVELGKADAACKIDCSSYAAGGGGSGTGDNGGGNGGGTGGGNSSPTAAPAGSAASCHILAKGITTFSLWLVAMMMAAE